MDIYKDQIETVRQEQMTLLRIYRNELARCPSGNLGTGKDHGKVRIYLTTLPKEYRVLDHRNFLTKLSMDKESPCDNTDEHDFAGSELESPLFLDASEKATKDRIERHREWGRSPFRQSSYKPEERNLPTSGGIFVRSKSELVIAEKLHTYDIPFHYEEIIPIGRYEYSADFTFECKGNELLYEVVIGGGRERRGSGELEKRISRC